MDENQTGYYRILGLEKTNDRSQIWEAFRTEGTKYLPEKESNKFGENSIKFAKV
jgi:DnaJ-class molecular chaperone